MHSLLYFDVAEITLWDYKTLRKCFSFATSDASRHGGLFLPLQNSRLSCRRLQMKNFPHGARTEEKKNKSESGGYNDSVLICLRKSGFAPQSIGRMNPDPVGTHQRQAAREEGGIITLLIIC